MDYLRLFAFELFEIICIRLFEIIFRLFVDYLSLDYLWFIRIMDYLRLFVFGLFEMICFGLFIDYW